MKCRVCENEASCSVTVELTELIEVTNYYCDKHYRDVLARRGLQEH